MPSRISHLQPNDDLYRFLNKFENRNMVMTFDSIQARGTISWGSKAVHGKTTYVQIRFGPTLQQHYPPRNYYPDGIFFHVIVMLVCYIYAPL